MSNDKTHAKNLLLNAGSYAITLLISFFLSPFVVGSLDSVSYGIWSLLNVLAGHMGVFDLGVRSSVGRHIALYLGRNDPKGVDETIRAGLAFFTLAGIAILLAGVVMGWLFPYFFDSVPVAYHRTVRMLLPVMVINVWLSAVAAIYSSLLTAYDRFDLARGIDAAVLIVRTAGTIAALLAGTGLWGMTAAVVAANVIALLGNFFLAHKQHKGLQSWPLLYSRHRFKEITNYGFAAFLTRASMKIIGQTDLLVAGAFVTVASVREYTVGATMIYYSSTFIAIIESTLFPSLQKSVGRNDIDSVRWLYFRQLRIAMLFLIPTFIGMAIFSRPFIKLWMMQPGFDENSSIIAAAVMSILAVSKLPLIFVTGSASVLAAVGRIHMSSKLTVVEAILNLVLSIVFVKEFNWGLYGIAASTLVATLLVRAIWIPFLACREIKIRGSQFIIELLIPAATVSILFAGLCKLIQYITPPDSWLMFTFDTCIVVIIFGIFGVPMLLPPEYREILLKKISNLIN